jgi:thioester reductase-like protein
LTGATGFLGAYLLRDLLRLTNAEVRCLVRASNEADGAARVRQALEDHHLWEESFAGRIVPILGDLSQPLLGLSEDRFDALAAEVDAIYHNGANVNFVLPYEALKSTNVSSTREVLKLAGQVRLKPIHFVSSIAVLGHLSRSEVHEGPVLKRTEHLFNGYAISKWVAERLLEQAASRGFQVAIYRPGTIGGDSETGAWNQKDLAVHLLQSFVRSGVAPELPMLAELTPVDHVSRAIVDLSLQPASLGRVFHLPAFRFMLTQVLACMADVGYALRLTPYHEWCETVVREGRTDARHPLHAYVPLLENIEVASQLASTLAQSEKPIEATNARALLTKDHILFDETSEDYFRRCIRRLAAQEQFPPPAGSP